MMDDLWQDTIIIGKGQGGGGVGFWEDAIEGGAAAGEGGVEGAVGVQGFLYFTELRVELEEGGFEIVGQLIPPGGDGLLDDVPEGYAVFPGLATGKGPGGADMDGWVYEDEAIGAEVQREGVQLFTAATAEAGFVEDEEGAVAAQPGGVAEESRGVEVEPELGVQGHQGKGAVGGTAAEARADGNIFIEMDLDGGQVGEIGF